MVNKCLRNYYKGTMRFLFYICLISMRIAISSFNPYMPYMPLRRTQPRRLVKKTPTQLTPWVMVCPSQVYGDSYFNFMCLSSIEFYITCIDTTCTIPSELTYAYTRSLVSVQNLLEEESTRVRTPVDNTKPFYEKMLIKMFGTIKSIIYQNEFYKQISIAYKKNTLGDTMPFAAAVNLKDVNLKQISLNSTYLKFSQYPLRIEGKTNLCASKTKIFIKQPTKTISITVTKTILVC
uniref:Uncharacterized protein n=1 Tax=Ranid herpesvirus 4 TaxID=2849006 RepID=A0A8F3HTC8_9VIRU|nr:MAG: hypothetical protein [Ranid herpesvirus 4]